MDELAAQAPRMLKGILFNPKGSHSHDVPQFACSISVHCRPVFGFTHLAPGLRQDVRSFVLFAVTERVFICIDNRLPRVLNHTCTPCLAHCSSP